MEQIEGIRRLEQRNSCLDRATGELCLRSIEKASRRKIKLSPPSAQRQIKSQSSAQALLVGREPPANFSRPHFRSARAPHLSAGPPLSHQSTHRSLGTIDST
jgi:hypothetical protein